MWVVGCGDRDVSSSLVLTIKMGLKIIFKSEFI